MKVGDHFSEVSRYTIISIVGDKTLLRHNSGSEVRISVAYLQEFCKSGNDFTRTEVIGLENKYWTAKQEKPEGVNTGDLKSLGLRQLWDSIPVGEVFGVEFKKSRHKEDKKIDRG